MPSNVAHTGHATSEEEAKKLIQQLMGGIDQPGRGPTSMYNYYKYNFCLKQNLVESVYKVLPYNLVKSQFLCNNIQQYIILLGAMGILPICFVGSGRLLVQILLNPPRELLAISLLIC